MADDKIEARPYAPKELAALYGVHSKTLFKWMKPFEKEIGEKTGRFYTVKQVRIIVDKLGFPGHIKESEIG